MLGSPNLCLFEVSEDVPGVLPTDRTVVLLHLVNVNDFCAHEAGIEGVWGG